MKCFYLDNFRGILNIRSTEHFADKEPGLWFPNVDMCGGEHRWKEYATFHHSVLSGKQDAKYLIYSCTTRKCGGYGNRIEGLTSLLIFAMLTNRVFLIKMEYPVNINDYFMPNAIQWNHNMSPVIKAQYFDLINPTGYYSNYEKFEASLLNQSANLMVRMNFGLFYHLVRTNTSLVKLIISKFNLKTHYDINLLYGCAFKYLFKYQPKTLTRIESTQSQLGLQTGKFISLHVRSWISDGYVSNPLKLEVPWSHMFKCAVMAAKALGMKLNVSKVPIFLAADHEEVFKYAKKNYANQVIRSPAPLFHIDRTHYTDTAPGGFNDKGFIGILSDVEIVARAGVLVRSLGSTMSDIMGMIHFFPPKQNLHPFYFYENLSLCKM